MLDKKLSFERKIETQRKKMCLEENERGLLPSSEIKEKKKDKEKI